MKIFKYLLKSNIAFSLTHARALKTVWLITGLIVLCCCSYIIAYAADTENDIKSPGEDKTAALFEPEFMVGVIDLNVGRLEPAEGADDYTNEITVDGRIAFYLKGKIKGKYLLTAQLDTGDEPIGKLLSRLTEKDPRVIFEKIDPDKYYPVYGDQSTMVRDVETQGKLYLRLEWDESKAILGNYQVSMNGTDLINYNRSLYGLQVNLKPRTGAADNPDGTQVFWALPQTVHARDILRFTGGSLYYLKHADVIMGSEQLSVEIRSSNTNEIINSSPLKSGRDYEIDYVQGRLILRRALESVIDTGMITTNLPLDGAILYLTADYDFEGTALMDNPSYGLRTSCSLWDRLQLGGSFVTETAKGSSYRIYGVDCNYRLGQNITLSGEWAESRESLSNRSYSDDGGLTYYPIAEGTKTTGSDSWKLGLSVALPDFSKIFTNVSLQTGYQFQEAGFSTAGSQSLNDNRVYGLTLAGDLFTDHSLRIRYNSVIEENVKDHTEVLAQLKQDGQKLKWTEELRYQNTTDLVKSQNSSNLLGAARLDYALNDAFGIYGSEQLTLYHNEAGPVNNRTGLGAKWDINRAVRLNIEGSTGSLGDSAILGGQYQLTDNHQLYGRYQYDSDTRAGKTFTTILGDKSNLTQNIALNTEYHAASGTYENSASGLIGFEYLPGDGWALSLSCTLTNGVKLAEKPFNYDYPGVVETEPENHGTGPFNRRIINFGVSRKSKTLEYKTGLQVGYDESDAQNTKQYLMTNLLRGSLNEDLSYYCKLNYSLTQNEGAQSDIARFGEGSMGIAYRPVQNDRLNLIGAYTYLEDLAPQGQIDGKVAGERSHVLSADGIYDLSKRWQLGEKLAYKRAEINDNGAWQSNDIYLWVNRLSFYLPLHWEISGEYRILNDVTVQDTKQGCLIAAYYHFDPATKAGVGFNFTDFNDDLVHQGGNASGWFINLVKQW